MPDVSRSAQVPDRWRSATGCKGRSRGARGYTQFRQRKGRYAAVFPNIAATTPDTSLDSESPCFYPVKIILAQCGGDSFGPRPSQFVGCRCRKLGASRQMQSSFRVPAYRRLLFGHLELTEVLCPVRTTRGVRRHPLAASCDWPKGMDVLAALAKHGVV